MRMHKPGPRAICAVAMHPQTKSLQYTKPVQANPAITHAAAFYPDELPT